MNKSRRQLWIAMSNLWLDTELTDEGLKWIVSAVRDSGLDRDELEVIFRHELAPFLGSNQRSVAGEWGDSTRTGYASGRRSCEASVGSWIGCLPRLD